MFVMEKMKFRLSFRELEVLEVLWEVEFHGAGTCQGPVA